MSQGSKYSDPRGPVKKQKAEPASSSTGSKDYSKLGGQDNTSSSPELEQVDAASAWECIQAVVHEGDAISFSLTSDGGALAITILSKGNRYKHYAHSKSEIEDLLNAISLL